VGVAQQHRLPGLTQQRVRIIPKPARCVPTAAGEYTTVFQRCQRLDSSGSRPKDLNQAVQEQAGQRSDCQALMNVKGVGPVTSLADVLTLCPVERFSDNRKLVSHLGPNPSEHSRGGRQRLGHISKQGNQMLHWLLVEAGHGAAQFDPELRREYQRLKFRLGW
jgi:transposase